MAEFEDKLNALLSNPDSMAQVMQLAQSLSSPAASAASAAPSPAAPTSPAAPVPPPAGGFDFLSVLSGLGGLGGSGGGGLGGIDPKLLTRMLPLLQELGSEQNGDSVRLLHALRPFLKEERQDKVERALQLARMIHLAKKFFAGWEA